MNEQDVLEGIQSSSPKIVLNSLISLADFLDRDAINTQFLNTSFHLLIPLISSNHFKIRSNSLIILSDILENWYDSISDAHLALPGSLLALLSVNKIVSKCGISCLKQILYKENPVVYWFDIEKTITSSRSLEVRIQVLELLTAVSDKIPLIPIVQLVDDPKYQIRRAALELLQTVDMNKLREAARSVKISYEAMKLLFSTCPDLGDMDSLDPNYSKDPFASKELSIRSTNRPRQNNSNTSQNQQPVILQSAKLLKNNTDQNSKPLFASTRQYKSRIPTASSRFKSQQADSERQPNHSKSFSKTTSSGEPGNLQKGKNYQKMKSFNSTNASRVNNRNNNNSYYNYRSNDEMDGIGIVVRNTRDDLLNRNRTIPQNASISNENAQNEERGSNNIQENQNMQYIDNQNNPYQPQDFFIEEEEEADNEQYPDSKQNPDTESAENPQKMKSNLVSTQTSPLPPPKLIGVKDEDEIDQNNNEIIEFNDENSPNNKEKKLKVTTQSSPNVFERITKSPVSENSPNSPNENDYESEPNGQNQNSNSNQKKKKKKIIKIKKPKSPPNNGEAESPKSSDSSYYSPGVDSPQTPVQDQAASNSKTSKRSPTLNSTANNKQSPNNNNNNTSKISNNKQSPNNNNNNTNNKQSPNNNNTSRISNKQSPNMNNSSKIINKQSPANNNNNNTSKISYKQSPANNSNNTSKISYKQSPANNNNNTSKMSYRQSPQNYNNNTNSSTKGKMKQLLDEDENEHFHIDDNFYEEEEGINEDYAHSSNNLLEKKKNHSIKKGAPKTVSFADPVGHLESTPTITISYRPEDLAETTWLEKITFLDNIGAAISSNQPFTDSPLDLIDCVLIASFPPHQKVTFMIPPILSELILRYPEVVRQRLTGLVTFSLFTMIGDEWQNDAGFDKFLSVFILESDPTDLIETALKVSDETERKLPFDLLIMCVYEEIEDMKLPYSVVSHLVCSLLKRFPLNESQEELFTFICDKELEFVRRYGMKLPLDARHKIVSFIRKSEKAGFSENSNAASRLQTSLNQKQKQQQKNANHIQISIPSNESAIMKIINYEFKLGPKKSNMQKCLLALTALENEIPLDLFVNFLNYIGKFTETAILENEEELSKLCMKHFTSNKFLKFLEANYVLPETVVGFSKIVWCSPQGLLQDADNYLLTLYEIFKNSSGKVRIDIIKIVIAIEKVTGSSILDFEEVVEPYRKLISSLIAQFHYQK